MLRPVRRRYRAAAMATAAVLVLAGCGSDDNAEDEVAQLTAEEQAQADAEAEAGPQTEVDPDSSLPGDTTVPDLEGTSLGGLDDPTGDDLVDQGDGSNARTEGFFAPSSPWNTRIDGESVDPTSDRMIFQSVRRLALVEDDEEVLDGSRTREDDTDIVVRDEGVYINTTAWTTPVVAGGEPTDIICRQDDCGDGDDISVLNVPTDVDPDPRYDGWFTIIDGANGVAYDLWRARREINGSITYHFLREWELDGPGYDTSNPPTLVSARGSGLPLFAGLIQPGELESGRIDHALAISIPAPDPVAYVSPASSTDGNGFEDSIPEGARLRLRADAEIPAPVDPITGEPIRLTPAQQRRADAITAALRNYGAIVVDRAAVPTLYAQRDVLAEEIDGNELQGIRMEDFEVLDLGREWPFPPEGDAQQDLLPRSEQTFVPNQGDEAQTDGTQSGGDSLPDDVSTDEDSETTRENDTEGAS